MQREEKNNALHKTFTFPDFPSALSWMVQCSFVIEQAQHHPERTNVYNKVIVKLTTHDAGNMVTEKDRELAKMLDQEYASMDE